MLKSYIYLRNRVARTEDEGATAVEYGLLVALIAAIIVGVVTALGTGINDAFGDVCDAIPGCTTP